MAPAEARDPVREALKRRCFRKCDADGDGFLRESEMRTFASFVGFSGSDEDWHEEYHKICSETGVTNPGIGVPESIVSELLDDESDNGCYCTNEELQQILGELPVEAYACKPDPEEDVQMAIAPAAADGKAKGWAGGGRQGQGGKGADGVHGAEGGEAAGRQPDAAGRRDAGAWRGGLRHGPRGQGGIRSADGRTLFFWGVPFETSPRYLQRLFRRAGRVLSFWLFTMPDGRSRGKGLVQYESAREAREALGLLSGTGVDGRKLQLAMDEVGALALGGPGPKAAEAWAEPEEVLCETNRVFFSGAPFEAPEALLRGLFEEYGPLRSFTLFHLEDGRSRGMGICTFVSSEAASEALYGGVQVYGWDLFLQEDQSQFAFAESQALATYGPDRGAKGGWSGGAGEGERRGWGAGRAAPYGAGAGRAALDGVDPNRAVFFKNAPFEVKEELLEECFEEVGRIRRFTLFRTPDGRSRGSGVVEYMNPVAATRAYYNLHGYTIDGRPLVVDEYRE